MVAQAVAFALAAALALASASTLAAQRSSQQRAEFKRQQPCPATGQLRGPCPGYIVDHVVPLCAGGPDHPSNMQWQTVADAKAKDRDEVRACRGR